MNEQKRLYTLLQLIRLLGQGVGYPVERLARRFDVTKRTIYRYLALLRDAGFPVVKKGRRYQIDSNGSGENLLPLLTEDELAILKETVYALPVRSPKRATLLEKFQAMTHPEQLIDLTVNRRLATIIHELTEAIHSREIVILKEYQSTGENPGMDRIVEPIGFTTNLSYLRAYDVEMQEVRLYKPNRMESVELTGDHFEHSERHHPYTPDPFGMVGSPKTEVELSCSRRAILLLQEEYPEIYCPKRVEAHGNRVTVAIQGFEGVGRFVLGLPGEITPEGPPEFLDYLREKCKKADWYTS